MGGVMRGSLVSLFVLLGSAAVAQEPADPQPAKRDRFTPEQRQQLRSAESLNARALELYRKGRGSEAVPFAEQALQIRRRILGEEHPATATSLNNLGLFYKTTGAYAKAEPLLRRLLEIYQKFLGDEHAKTATGLVNLGSL
ncbi:MAG: tetratricopeptide repeat protein, partial [Planctomycetota bacterium]|nr:tetratricopeptide repeat protein [Planctomycetota bacterium]